MMNCINKVYILGTILLALSHSGNVYSASVLERDSTSAFVFQFRFKNSLLLYDYKKNAAELDRLRDIVKDSTKIEIERIDITGLASPDGYDAVNIPLAHERAIAVRGYLYWQYPYLKQIPITIDSWVGDWSTVIEAVENDYDVPNRSKVLMILKSKFDNPTRTADLRALKGGAYEYLLNNMLSKQRGAVTCMLHYKAVQPIDEKPQETPQVIIKDTVAIVVLPEPPIIEHTETIVVEQIEPVISMTQYNKPRLSIKTDLAEWIGLTSAFDGLHAITPNLSLEFLFANRWSFEVGYAYSNWNSMVHEKGLWAASRGWIEPRFWFKNDDMFSGFYLGLYGQYGSYDTQSMITGHTGTFYSAGISIGYAQPLSKDWLLELGFRGSYRNANGVIYDIESYHYYYNRDENESKFVPQVRLNLIYRIGRPL